MANSAMAKELQPLWWGECPPVSKFTKIIRVAAENLSLAWFIPVLRWLLVGFPDRTDYALATVQAAFLGGFS